jgi:hypothetical protein
MGKRIPMDVRVSPIAHIAIGAIPFQITEIAIIEIRIMVVRITNFSAIDPRTI